MHREPDNVWRIDFQLGFEPIPSSRRSLRA